MNFIAGTAWTVWRNSDGVTPFDPGSEFQQGLRTTTARGTAHRLDIKVSQCARQHPSIVTRADKTDQSCAPNVTTAELLPDAHRKCEAIVPDAENHRSQLLAQHTMFINHFEPPRPRPE